MDHILEGDVQHGLNCEVEDRWAVKFVKAEKTDLRFRVFRATFVRSLKWVINGIARQNHRKGR